MTHCQRFPQSRVVNTEDWLAKHKAHGEPSKTYPDKQPPSYRLAQLHCPCGATHTMSEDKETDPK